MQTKSIVLLLMIPLMLAIPGWNTDLDKAKQQAVYEHKNILLSFSGSDWCGPCIKMHHDFFDNPDFGFLAEKYLVLVNADFPRQKKNQLPKVLQENNNRLADKYNPNGVFPLTLLLDAKGNVLKTWEGYPKLTAAEFIGNIKNLAHVAE